VGDVRWREVAGNQKEREIREDSREVVMVVELVVFSSCDVYNRHLASRSP
jgi:hypothetical protein